MEIWCTEKNIKISQQVDIAETFWSRFRGLMGTQRLPTGKALLIKRCNSIHTCFMRFSIDVLFLSKTMQVVRVIRVLKPWRLTLLYPRATQVLEMSGNTLNRDICVGDQLEVRE